MKSGIAVVLSIGLVLGGKGPQASLTPLSKDQQAFHAADRLTFGARPGDADRVRKLGIEKWIEEQLHPERIPENPALGSRIAKLESLQLSSAELLAKYPSNVTIALMARGTLPMPQDPLLRAGVQRAVERYKARQKDGQAGEPGAADPATGAARGRIVEILGVEQARTLRNGTPPEKQALLASLPPEKVDELLLALPENARRGLIANGPVEMRRKAILTTAPQQVIAFDLNENKLQRAIYSNRQLEELLVDFWYNHFNVFLDKGADRHLVPSYERDAIRPNVLGKFRDLLAATAHHPAMLFYLDNWQSVAAVESKRMNKQRATRGLNENYARELLELHTLGVEGGYTQKDITEVARCLTGWSIREPRRTAEFLYNDRAHDKGEKTVLGVKIAAGGGQDDGDKVLDIVASHPSTAKFISRKLAVRFVSDDPPQALVDRMATTFTRSRGDLRETMRTMLLSKEFMSTAAFRAKVKTPFEMVVSAARVLNADVNSTVTMARELAQLGQPLYRKVEPTGYSSRNSDWINSSALLGRMNVALTMAQNKLAGVKSNVPANLDQSALEKAYVPAGLSESTRASLAKALQAKEAKPETIAGLLLGSPEFQRK